MRTLQEESMTKLKQKLKKRLRKLERLKNIDDLRELLRREPEEISNDMFEERRQIADQARFTFKPSNFHPTVDQRLYDKNGW